ncbi:MAG: trans-sulfuration enzyme family protein, partial [Fusobacteriaceae bacterium]
MKKFDKTKLRTETILCHAGENRSEHQGAVVPPIYQNSLFTFDDWDGIDEAFSTPKTSRIYTRGNNPSALITEEKIAVIANGERAKLFASGMGAISSAILHFVKNGDHIITINNVYGPAANFMKNYLVEKCGIETTFVSGESVADFENALKANTRLIYLESPSSAIFSLQDIKAIVTLAKKHNIHTVIDNTWATPLFQKPLDMGVDVEVHSCSKYLNGHSDVVAGVAIGKREIIDAIQSDEA